MSKSKLGFLLHGSTKVSSVISVDVEDYFQVQAFSRIVNREQWDSYPTRVVENTQRLLDYFDQRQLTGTFFILGWVADKFPGLVRDIVARGHEPACHSYWHRLVYSLTPEEFRRDTERAKACIEDAAGERVVGYRAPSFSITRRCPWAVDILADLGFEYDSSVFPVRHDFYGIHDAPRRPFRLMGESGSLAEYPMTTFRVPQSPNLPVGGGGYLRMLPYRYTQFGLKRAQSEGIPVICYIHPWEIDPEQPRFEAPLTSRIRHYTNLEKTLERLDGLLSMSDYQAFREWRSDSALPLWSINSTPAPQKEREVANTGWLQWIDNYLDTASVVDLEGLS